MGLQRLHVRGVDVPVAQANEFPEHVQVNIAELVDVHSCHAGPELAQLFPQRSGPWRVLEAGEIELLLSHPSGVIEMYVGRRDLDRPSVQLRTDGVLRSPAAKEYNAGSRLYGLVGSELLWAMDMAAVGQGMQNHLSAQLKRVG